MGQNFTKIILTDFRVGAPGNTVTGLHVGCTHFSPYCPESDDFSCGPLFIYVRTLPYLLDPLPYLRIWKTPYQSVTREVQRFSTRRATCPVQRILIVLHITHLTENLIASTVKDQHFKLPPLHHFVFANTCLRGYVS